MVRLLRRVGLLGLGLVIGTVLLLAGNAASASEADLSLVGKSTDLALDSIREAEAAGADISGLVTRFNEAVDLIRKAEQGDTRVCSYDDCILEADQRFIGIVRDSALLKQEAEVGIGYLRIMSFTVFAPVGAFIGSIIVFMAYNAWKSSQVKRFLNLEIREKEA